MPEGRTAPSTKGSVYRGSVNSDYYPIPSENRGFIINASRVAMLVNGACGALKTAISLLSALELMKLKSVKSSDALVATP